MIKKDNLFGGKIVGKKRAVSVRRIAETLAKLHNGSFSTDFEENKRIISEMTQFPSRAARNKVAGYITRSAKSSEMEETQESLLPEESPDEKEENEA